ncbi:MAG: DUF1499 domain-containing protein [Caldilineaceae bacterium]|nr:DUF1499 domain-containing protein [Caldilineaceae bacterium]
MHTSGVVSSIAAESRLAPCPATPNCVSSQSTPDDEEHWIAPLTFAGSLEDARSRILAVVAEMPRHKIVVAEDDYLHIEFRSRIFRFVDDVEFLFDGESKLIQLRSAARLGKSDLGVNRKRMEEIRRAFAE